MNEAEIRAALERADREYAAWGLDREPDIEFGQCARDRLALARDLLVARERIGRLERVVGAARATVRIMEEHDSECPIGGPYGVAQLEEALAHLDAGEEGL